MKTESKPMNHKKESEDTAVKVLGMTAEEMVEEILDESNPEYDYRHSLQEDLNRIGDRR